MKKMIVVISAIFIFSISLSLSASAPQLNQGTNACEIDCHWGCIAEYPHHLNLYNQCYSSCAYHCDPFALPIDEPDC